MNIKKIVKQILYPIHTRPRFKRMYVNFLGSQKRWSNMRAQKSLRRCFVDSGGAILDWAHVEQKRLSPNIPAPATSVFFPGMEEAASSSFRTG